MEEEFNWSKLIIPICVLIVLFFTNPKQPEKHLSAINNRIDHIVTVIDAEINRLQVSSGGRFYRLRSSSAIRKDLMKKCKEIEIVNGCFFSLGIAGGGVCKTIGVLGMVFDVSSLSISDQSIRDIVMSQAL